MVHKLSRLVKRLGAEEDNLSLAAAEINKALPVGGLGLGRLFNAAASKKARALSRRLRALAGSLAGVSGEFFLKGVLRLSLSAFLPDRRSQTAVGTFKEIFLVIIGLGKFSQRLNNPGLNMFCLQ